VGVRWGWLFYRELQRDRAFVRAAGMAYATLVALVPGLVLVFGVLGATGSDMGEVTAQLLDQLFGEVPQVRDVLMPGLVGVDLGALGVVATGGLLFVAGRLYLNVELAYNDIFGTTVRRSAIARLLNFYFTITVIPVVVVFTVHATWKVALGYGYNDALAWLASVLELALLVAALKIFPSVHVRWGPAIVGGVTSFVLVELGRRGFALYVTLVAADDPLRVVYGSLGLLPVFLLWVYLLWVSVLLGVEVANVLQNYTSLVEAEVDIALDRHGHAPQVDVALAAAAWAGWHYEQGLGPASTAFLARRAGVEHRVMERAVAALGKSGHLVPVGDEVVLARPPRQVSLVELVAVCRASNPIRSMDTLVSELDEALSLRGSLADAIERWCAPDPSSPLEPLATIEGTVSRAG
jgi:YihY family inner membrane protein